MTDKQLYFLCGTIALSAGRISGFLELTLTAFFFFLASILESKKP